MRTCVGVFKCYAYTHRQTPLEICLWCLFLSRTRPVLCQRWLKFPSIRHNEIRDLTATLLTEVCNDVCIEPELQPVNDEELKGSIANSQAGACHDIAANGVWGGTFERTYILTSGYSTPCPIQQAQ